MVLSIKKILNERNGGTLVQVKNDILSACDRATDLCLMVTNNFEKDLDCVTIWEMLASCNQKRY